MFCKLIFHFSFTPGGYLSVDGMCSGWAGRLVMGLTDMFFFFFEGDADVFTQKFETVCAKIQCFTSWPAEGHTSKKKKKKQISQGGEDTYSAWRTLCIDAEEIYIFYYCTAYFMGTGVLLCMRLKLHELQLPVWIAATCVVMNLLAALRGK